MQDLVHLERGGQGFDQHGHFHLADRQAQAHFDEGQHLIPQLRFFHALQLGQVEIRAEVLRRQCRGVVEGEQAEVEQGPGQARAIDADVFFIQVPAARTHHQHGQAFGLQRVVLAAVRRHPVQGAGHGLAQRALAGQQVGPGGRCGIFEIGHVDARPRVQRVDHHLGFDRAGDFDAAVQQGGRQLGDLPVGFANGAGVFAEVGQLAGIKTRGADATGDQPGLAGRLEAAMQFGQEVQGRRGQQLGLTSERGGGQFDARNGIGVGGFAWGNVGVVHGLTVKRALEFDKANVSIECINKSNI